MEILERERLTQERGKQICETHGYTNYVVFPNGRDACINKLAFTYAILADLTEWGYGDRWCFSSIWLAMEALAEWQLRDGEGEPNLHWTRHPDSGRRRPDGDASKEYINY